MKQNVHQLEENDVILTDFYPGELRIVKNQKNLKGYRLVPLILYKSYGNRVDDIIAATTVNILNDKKWKFLGNLEQVKNNETRHT